MVNRILSLVVLLLFGGMSLSIAQDMDLRYIGISNTTTVYSTQQLLSLMITSGHETDEGVFLEFTVHEKDKGLVASLRSDGFIMPAKRTITGPAFPGFSGRLETLFAQAGFDQIGRQSFQFPTGNYKICALLKGGESVTLDQACFTIGIQQFNKLHLIYPFDEQVVEEALPVFSWTPTWQTNMSRVQYRVRWVEAAGRMSAMEFNEKPAFLIQENVSATFFPYASTLPAFDREKEYYWKVQAVDGDVLIAESEVWSFKFDQPIRQPVSLAPFIKLDADSDRQVYYLHGQDLQIELDNPYSKSDIAFQISRLDNKRIIKGLWSAGEDVEYGKNQMTIKLGNKVQKEIPHRLLVTLPNQILELLFIKI